MNKQMDEAIAMRFEQIGDTFERKDGDYVYDNYRCTGAELGWRLRQKFGVTVHPTDVANGVFDTQIESTWHEAAGAAHWYIYEKDYGDD